MGFVFFKILNCRTTRRDSRGSGDIGSTMSALNDVADGNYNRAIIKAGAIGAGKISDGIIDKTIPAGGATNATVKAANSWYIDQVKTESINSTYRR